MYDYRTSPKKRGSVVRRPVSPKTRVTLSSISANRRSHRPLRSAFVRRTRASTPSGATFSSTSWLLGGGILVLLLVIGYWLLLQLVLPALIPVQQDEVIALINRQNPEQHAVTLVRFSPTTQQLVIVRGNAPQAATTSAQIPLAWRLGVPIDRTIQIESAAQELSRDTVEEQLWNLIVAPQSGDIKRQEAVAWWLFVRSAAKTRVSLVDVVQPQDWVQVRRKLIDQTNGRHCPVAVVNTTGVGGAATQLTALLEPAGFLIIKVGDNQLGFSQTEIMLDPTQPECLSEAEQLASFMIQPTPIQQQENLVTQYRAPIVIGVGHDLAAALQAWLTVTP